MVGHQAILLGRVKFGVAAVSRGAHLAWDVLRTYLLDSSQAVRGRSHSSHTQGALLFA